MLDVGIVIVNTTVIGTAKTAIALRSTATS